MNTKVRNYLIELSRQKANLDVTYQKLSDDCNLGLQLKGNLDDTAKLGAILTNISNFEYYNNRPLLSALIIRPRYSFEIDSFYKMAQSLGFGDWQNLKGDGIFEIMQIKECINFWRNETNYLLYKEVQIEAGQYSSN